MFLSLVEVPWWWIDIHFTGSIANEDFFSAGCHPEKLSIQGKFHQNLSWEGGILSYLADSGGSVHTF